MEFIKISAGASVPPVIDDTYPYLQGTFLITADGNVSLINHERGFNNAQIGLELGYSESLIRQETVAIYRKLQVTGRKAMQAIKALNLQAQDLIDKENEEIS